MPDHEQDQPQLPSHNRAIIHVDMDAFYASVEQRDDPSIRGKAVIVGGLGPRGVVSAASYEARALGVHSAMPMGRARRLAPNAEYLRPRIEHYREVSRQIFRQFREFTPQVEGLSLDEAFLDVTASLRLFGTRENIGAALRDRIHQETQLVASVGMAHNKFLAKLASDAQKPAGFVSIPEDRVREFLDPMPVGRLWGIGRKTEPRLHAQGILTIGQLRRSDPRILEKLLGRQWRRYQQLACGLDDREVCAHREDKSISHEVTFDNDKLDEGELRSELQRQAIAVARRLRKHGWVARTVQLKIRDSAFRTYTRSLTLRAPSNSTDTVYTVARGLLKRWLESHHNTPVRLIGVGTSNLETLDGQEMRTPPLDETVDRITDKFGDSSLLRAGVLKRPE